MKTVKSPRPEKVLEKFPGILLKASNTDDAELGKLIKHENYGIGESMEFIDVYGMLKIWSFGVAENLRFQPI